jgi:hypothetical protein
MQTLEMSLNESVGAGIVAFDEATARSHYPKEIAQPLGLSSTRIPAVR